MGAPLPWQAYAVGALLVTAGVLIFWPESPDNPERFLMEFRSPGLHGALATGIQPPGVEYGQWMLKDDPYLNATDLKDKWGRYEVREAGLSFDSGAGTAKAVLTFAQTPPRLILLLPPGGNEGTLDGVMRNLADATLSVDQAGLDALVTAWKASGEEYFETQYIPCTPEQELAREAAESEEAEGEAHEGEPADAHDEPCLVPIDVYTGKRYLTYPATSDIDLDAFHAGLGGLENATVGPTPDLFWNQGRILRWGDWQLDLRLQLLTVDGELGRSYRLLVNAEDEVTVVPSRASPIREREARAWLEDVLRQAGIQDPVVEDLRFPGAQM